MEFFVLTVLFFDMKITQPEILYVIVQNYYKHRTKRKFPPKYIRINSKQMNRCSSNLELIGPMVGCLMVCKELGHTCVK